MTIRVPNPIHGHFDQRQVRSRALFHADFRRALIEALTGQVANFSRSGTGTAADSVGTTATWNRNRPVWRVTSGTVGLLLGGQGSAEILRYPILFVPRELTAYVEFIERGTGTSDRILHIGEDDNSNPRFQIYRHASSGYSALYHDGSNSRESTLAVGTLPSSGDLVTLRATISATGVVQIHQSINGAAEVSATASSTNTIASAWSDGQLYVNSRGASDEGDAEYRRVKVFPGTLTLSEIAGRM